MEEAEDPLSASPSIVRCSSVVALPKDPNSIPRTKSWNENRTCAEHNPGESETSNPTEICEAAEITAKHDDRKLKLCASDEGVGTSDGNAQSIDSGMIEAQRSQSATSSLLEWNNTFSPGQRAAFKKQRKKLKMQNELEEKNKKGGAAISKTVNRPATVKRVLRYLVAEEAEEAKTEALEQNSDVFHDSAAAQQEHCFTQENVGNYREDGQLEEDQEKQENNDGDQNSVDEPIEIVPKTLVVRRAAPPPPRGVSPFATQHVIPPSHAAPNATRDVITSDKITPTEYDNEDNIENDSHTTIESDGNSAAWPPVSPLSMENTTSLGNIKEDFSSNGESISFHLKDQNQLQKEGQEMCEGPTDSNHIIISSQNENVNRENSGAGECRFVPTRHSNVAASKSSSTKISPHRTVRTKVQQRVKSNPLSEDCNNSAIVNDGISPPVIQIYMAEEGEGGREREIKVEISGDSITRPPPPPPPPWEELDGRILVHIFTFLPWTDLCSASLVCKSWREIATSDLLHVRINLAIAASAENVVSETGQATLESPKKGLSRRGTLTQSCSLSVTEQEQVKFYSVSPVSERKRVPTIGSRASPVLDNREVQAEILAKPDIFKPIQPKSEHKQSGNFSHHLSTPSMYLPSHSISATNAFVHQRTMKLTSAGSIGTTHQAPSPKKLKWPGMTKISKITKSSKVTTKEPPNFGERSFHILATGYSQVGTTSLVKSFVDGKMPTHYEPTLEDEHELYIIVDGGCANLKILDASGHEDFLFMIPEWVKKSEGALLIYSIKSKASFERVKQHKMEIDKLQPNHPIVLVATHRDSIQREIDFSEGVRLAEEWKCPFFETSSPDEFNISAPFIALVREMRSKRQLIALNESLYI